MIPIGITPGIGDGTPTAALAVLPTGTTYLYVGRLKWIEGTDFTRNGLTVTWIAQPAIGEPIEFFADGSTSSSAGSATDVGICKRALRNLGITVGFTSIAAPTTKEEIECSLVYADTRDEVLAAAQWRFNQKRLPLTELGVPTYGAGTTYAQSADVTYAGEVYISLQAGNVGHTPNVNPTWWFRASRDEWAKVYSLPSDFLFADFIAPQDARAAFEKGAHPISGELLYTNTGDAVLQYRARVTDVPSYPAWFIKLLAWKLAEVLCPPLNIDVKLTLEVEKKAARAFVQATAAALKQRQDDSAKAPDSVFLTARSGAATRTRS